VTVVDAKHVTQHLDDEKPEGFENEARPYGRASDCCAQFTSASGGGTLNDAS